jgi:hypothetical protein
MRQAMRRNRAALAAIIAISASAVLTGAFIYDGVLVETSPVGQYYHYDYDVRINTMESGNYTLMIPMIVSQNGTPVYSLVPNNAGGDANFTQVSTQYGLAFELQGRGNVSLLANSEYDALHLSKDHVSDGDPGFSLWNRSAASTRPGKSRDAGIVRLFSSLENITISVHFESWSKSWHVREGVFHSGYERGGGGHSIYIGKSRPVVLGAGWGDYTVDWGDIAVE